ncbi:hypothetical protein QQ045_033099 [Rhodiola kirilowii]
MISSINCIKVLTFAFGIVDLEGENEQHGEKKSVLKKVKAKAKKIKETIKKHGHLHDHDPHEHHPDYDEEDEDEYQDEETNQEDPEVHVARNLMARPEAPNLERTDEPTAGKDHTRLGVPSSHAHGLGTGFTEGSSIGQLIIPEEAPLAPRNTPVSHGEDHQRVAAHGLEQPSRYRKILDDSPLIAGETVEHDSARQGSYTEKLAYVTASLADKVVAAKDVTASKLGYGDEKKNEIDGQSDRSQTRYTEKASQAASLLTEKAISVKDMVAAKLGYGGAEEHKTPHEPVDHEALMQQKQSSYMGKISGVGSVLANKAVGAKNAVTLKFGRGAATEGTTWSEKLKPGDEDKALSELICGTFYKGGSTHQGDMKEPASDAVHKRANEHDDDDDSRKKVEVKLMGRVTESEEVARRLGTSEEEKRGEVTYVPGDGSPSKPVADMIKSAVSSWWTANNQTPQQHPRDTSESGTGERRLQESAN